MDLTKTSWRRWALVLLGAVVLSQTASGATAPPARELAQEILRDPAFQKELLAQPKPDRPESGCDHSGDMRIRSAPVGAGGAGSIFSLLAWLAVGVAVALAAAWVGAAVVRYRRDALADAAEAEEAVLAATGVDPSLAMVQRLAAQGRYAQAIHELLLLSVTRLAERHGRSVSGWLTSRELIRLLPATEDERVRFTRLVAWVERCLFGGQQADRGTFDECLADFTALGLA